MGKMSVQHQFIRTETRKLRTRLQLLILIIITAAAGSAFGQTRSFKWETELCIHTGKYDSKKYTEQQLRNTVRMFHLDEFRLSTNSTVWKYEEIADLDIAGLEKEYKEKSESLSALDIVKTPYWETVRRDKLRSMKENYELYRVTMLGYKDPKILRTYSGAETCKLNYAEPIIAGGASLINAWRKVNKDSQSRNADPARLQREFDAENASSDRFKFALVETMAFGWHNCVNATFPIDDRDLHTEFEKLFTNVKSECDEP